ncbi:MAG: hypothetical protein AB8B91_07435 [Rubripirellula sp.]
MSLMYEVLDHYQEAYEAEMGDQDQAVLEHAIERLQEAYEEVTLEKHLEGFREAAMIAKKLGDEEVSFIFDFHLANALIGTANLLEEGIEVVLPGAIKSRGKDYEDKPHRIGLNNMLATAYLGSDPIGNADEIRLITTMISEHPLADAEDIFIAMGNLYECELSLGEIEKATQACDRVRQCAEELNSVVYFTSYATFETELAFLAQDWEAMLRGAEQCWEMLVTTQNQPVEGEEEEDDFEDADFLSVAAAEACALAKLGRADEVDEPEVCNPDPEAPAQYNFYLYWCEFHSTVGNHEVAVEMAKEGVEETVGKGQHYREVQMICVLVCRLRAAGKMDQIQVWEERAREVAGKLSQPESMVAQIEAAISG